jgi:hypothetical protein
MHTARMPCRLHSMARPQARLATAARPAEACADPGIPRSGLKPTNTINPPPPGIIVRIATPRVMLQTASTVTSWTAREPFSEISSAGAENWPPALLTSTSIVSKRSSAASMTRSTPGRSRRSADTARQSAAGTHDLAAHLLERLRATAAHDHTGPRAASSSAVARPMPVPPPVTSATLPAFASGRSGERIARHQLRFCTGAGPSAP